MTFATIFALALTNVTGIVTFERQGMPFYFVTDDSGSHWRIAREETSIPVAIGDRIYAEGVKESSAVKNRLATKSLKVLSHGSEPEATNLTIRDLFKNIMPFGNSDWYGGLFSVEGILRDINRRQLTTQLLVGEGELNIQVEIPLALEDAMPDNFVPGATVRVTGSLAYTSIENYDEAIFGRIENVELIPRSLSDIEVVRRAPSPPFWNTQRVVSVLGIAGAIVAILFAWVATLRKMVVKRTNELAESIRANETARIEADAARRERLRLAADLHDGFQQYLAGAMFRLKAALNYLPSDADRSRSQLEKVQEALQHTQSGLRSTLWAMNEESEGPESLRELFDFATRRMAHWEGKVEIKTHGEERHVARKSAGTLLLIMQEAVGNALRHGRAEHVRVRLVFAEGTLTMKVTDDGIGFDSAASVESGHYGLSGMERRTSEHGGEMKVWSRRGIGSVLTFAIPCS